MLLNQGFRQKGTREMIIEILGREYPLTINQINSHLRKKYGIRVTYQAIHIFLRDFMAQGIVAREGKGYMLQPRWVESAAAAANEVFERYSKSSGILPPTQVQELNFSSIMEAWGFLLQKANSGYFGKSENCYIQLKRMFTPILTDKQVSAIREFTGATKTILFCHSKGPVERLAANFLRSQGVDVRLGVPCATPTNTALIGNSVVSIYILYPHKEAVDRLYSSIRDVLRKDVFSIFSGLIERKIRVKLIINRNPEVYRDVLEQTKKLQTRHPNTIVK